MTTALLPTSALDDPHRYAPGVPLVVLPDTRYRVLPWRRPEAAVKPAAAALAALDRLIDAAGESDTRALRSRLPDGVTALGRLAEALADGALPTDTMPPSKLIYSYFGVRHSDTMGSTSMALYAVLIARWSLAELEYAAVDGNQIVALLAGLRTIIAGLADTPLPPRPPAVAPEPVDPQPLLDYLPDGGPEQRWVVAHHAYLCLNMMAAGSVEAAANCLREVGFEDRAAAHLRTAALQVRGFTAAMLWSAVLPGRLYLEVVRPTMAPPYLPKGLTGGAFLEHKQHHQRIRELLGRYLGGLPYAELALRHPGLADARDRLFEADLADIEQHTVMGEHAIHDLRSLVQTRPEENAVVWLRRRRAARVELYRPYTQYGAVQA
jgi:hypothetical protein